MYKFTGNATLDDLERIVLTHEQMHNHYFWNPPNNATMRRKFEKMNSHEEISWTENGDFYTAATVCTCSCQHIYYKGVFSKNGKKTTSKAIKNSYQKMLMEYIERGESVNDK